jgi:hypothetical protein
MDEFLGILSVNIAWTPQFLDIVRGGRRIERLTGMAKVGCPVFKLFKADITLDATLVD